MAALTAAPAAFAQHAAAPASADQPPLTALTAGSGGIMPAEQARLHFDHADLHFQIEPSTRSLAASATLSFTAKQDTDAILLDLDRNLPISLVAVDGQPVGKDRWSNPEGRLRIALGHTLAAGRSVNVTVNYAGQPHRAKRAPWDGGFVWSHTPDGKPWVASAVEGEGCDLFWPCIDQPEGEPDLVDTYVTVARDLAVPGNGILIGITEQGDRHTYHWRIKHPDTYAIAINVGPYKLMQGSYASRYGNTIPLQYWYLPGEEAQAKTLFAQFTPMLDFFEREIGPYPFGDEKMGVVETPYEGMEHQTINAYGNPYPKSPYGFDWLLQHEFSHEWFGNQITNVDWDDMWLHEGFGTYMQPLYGQYLHGDMPYFAMLQDELTLLHNRYPVVAGRSLNEHDVSDDDHGPGTDIYYKASLMLHTLRSLIGDKAFFESTRRLVYGRPDPRPGNFRPRYASTNDFIEIVHRVSGRDLRWFFDVYLREASLPRLLTKQEGRTLTLRWVVPHDKPFPMPVDVQVDDTVHTVDMAGGSASLQVPAGALVIVDPRSKLLRDEPHIAELQAWQHEQMAKHARILKPW